MNCKKGEWAVVVRSMSGNEGKIVRCLEEVGVFLHITFGVGPAWRIDRPLPCSVNGATDLFMDACLIPLRHPGDDAVDESKAWLPPVPLPKIEPALLPAKEAA